MHFFTTPAVLLLGTSLLACASSADLHEPEDPQLTRCEVDGSEAHVDLAELDARLAAAPAVAQALGLGAVASCEDAARALAALRAHDEDAPSEAGQAPLPRAAIMNATASNVTMNGLVALSGCTGVLINQRAILTAAHCVDQLIAPAKNGDANLQVARYITTGQDLIYNGLVRINIHPSYDGDVGYDLAIVKLYPPATFPQLDDDDRTRIYTGLGSTVGSMRLYGRGFSDNDGNGLGVLRYMIFSPDWWGPEHFLEDGGPQRTCNGDSGGPTIDWTPAGRRVVIGIHSNSDKIGDNLCNWSGGKKRSVRLHHKIDWIEDMLDVTCAPGDDDGWSYVRCW